MENPNISPYIIRTGVPVVAPLAYEARTYFLEGNYSIFELWGYIIL